MHPLSILLVEDDDEARHLYCAGLERAGHQVTPVGRGQDAIALLESRRFDVVVTDIVMPDVDGLEIITATLRLQPQARLVAMSGGSSHLGPEFYLRLAGALGGSATLPKPFSEADLLRAIAGSPRDKPEVFPGG